ncbi:Indoleamine 2,3-dioxygenase [Crepidotus variabilis]|uniref:Indoleamine 2,3-dioxygenase n=1 Tax=Crepidotus variabilis TaxID=179855 RepID=A0A9P6ERQ1_9AGAR|nr:Indoleamine 2,3-dioxygenase [Crepidotus variabilis]
METNYSIDGLKVSIPIAQDFDVDNRTGFMAPRPPVTRLPESWEPWEDMLDRAVAAKIKLGDALGTTPEEAKISFEWRVSVRAMHELSESGLEKFPELLRRAHLVLAFLLHFYVQSLPPDEPIVIPSSISLPMLRISKFLDIPPLLTFSDTVLYNWDFRIQPNSKGAIPALDNIRTATMFTNSVDEEEFYLCSARIELRGVQILELMRLTMDETFVGDDITVRRLVEYLDTIAEVVGDLKMLLMDVKKLCDPDIYYNEVRPWFRGEDSVEPGQQPRKWVFEGLENDPRLSAPAELSGPSAGQSSLIHVLDIFLGVDHQPTSPGRAPFMSRMQKYMPRNHRLFLDHLKANPRPLRIFVMEKNDVELTDVYNKAVVALKEFRDAHMIIATLYILGPARRAAKLAADRRAGSEDSTSNRDTKMDTQGVKGTGGTDLVRFLKDTRARTTESLISH